MRSLFSLVCVVCFASWGNAAALDGLEADLQRVIIPRLKCKDLPVRELLPALEKRVSRESKGRLHPHIGLNVPDQKQPYAVSLDLHGVPANEVIEKIADQAGLEVRYAKFQVILELSSEGKQLAAKKSPPEKAEKVTRKALVSGAQIREVTVGARVVTDSDSTHSADSIVEEPVLPLVEPVELPSIALASIGLPEMNFNDVSFTDALRQVREQVALSTGEKLEVRYHGNRNRGEAAGSEKITMRIGSAPASEVIRALGQYAGYDVEFGEVVRFRPFSY